MIQIIFYIYIVCGVIAALTLIQDELDSIFDSVIDFLAKTILFFIFIIFWPGFFYIRLKQKLFPEPTPDRKPYTVPIEWLTTKTSISEVEQKNLVQFCEQPGLELPFGYQNSTWEEVKRSSQDSDEIWEFSSPAKSWKLLAGRAGVCIVRNGKVIDGIVTIMN